MSTNMMIPFDNENGDLAKFIKSLPPGSEVMLNQKQYSQLSPMLTATASSISVGFTIIKQTENTILIRIPK